MKKSRSSQAKKQISERFRLMMLFVKCCGRQPTAEELDGTDAVDEDVHKDKDTLIKFNKENINGQDNGAGDTLGLESHNETIKRPLRPKRPPCPKRPPPPKVRENTDTDILVKDIRPLQEKADIRTECDALKGYRAVFDIDGLSSKRPLHVPKRRVPPKRPPPPTNAPPLKRTTPPLRPPPPPAHLVADLIRRNKKVAEIPIGQDNERKAAFDGNGRNIADYPAELNPFPDDDN